MSLSTRLSTAAAAALVVSVSLSVSLAVAPAARADGPLAAFLPKSGAISGHVVTFAVAPEDEAISQRFQRAVQGNMDWFKKAVTSNAPGQPLPYDKRMAISEAEYDRLLKMTPELKQGAAVTVAVTKSADGAIGFKPDGAQGQSLKDVTFPPDEKVASTPYGQLAIFNNIDQKTGASPWGAWKGVEWAQVMESDADQPSAKIAFGKREKDGQGVMYYQVAPYKDHEQQSLVIFYKLD